jgi:prophage antirepressor-like protein
MAAQSLVFRNINLKPIHSDNGIWIGVTQIGLALEYSNPETAITKIFNRRSDEFSSLMARLLSVKTNGGTQEVRVFSLRGALDSGSSACYGLSI